jgi:WD40 repeat protein
MKKWTAMGTLIFLVLLSACNNPIIVPADVAITLPPNQDFILMATVPATPEATGASPAAEMTATQPGPTATSTLTQTPTPTSTPVPTRKSPYPVSQATPLIDSGFETISVDNIGQLRPVFSAITASPRHATMSADGKKLFLSSSDGIFLFNRQGESLAHWPNIFTAAIACESCISANRDGSRLAVITRNSGAWEAQVYDIQGDQATQVLALPVETSFKGSHDEASIAISPDNTYLAFRAGSGPVRVLDLQSKLQVFNYERRVDGISFTPDGSRFVVHAGQEMLFYKVNDWKSPSNLLLPREDIPYAFSPDGHLVAIALPTLLRIYTVENLRMVKEINVPPSNASTRQWQIAFTESGNLSGYAIRWDTNRSMATVETGQWNIQSGEALNWDTSSTNAPDALAGLWGSAISLPRAQSKLETSPSDYQAFRFISDGILLINSPHSICWLKLLTGEDTCFQDPDHNLFASDANSFKEVRDNYNTNLVGLRDGAQVIQVGPYRIANINRSGEWALIDNGSGTDLYIKGKKLPQESVKGSPQGFAENANLIVFTTLENENSYTITVVDKTSGDAIFQKKDNFLYKPVVMSADGSIYYAQKELGRNQTVFNMIDPKTKHTNEITRISLPADTRSLTLSTGGLFGVGLDDGSVLVMTKDGGQSASFQAATSPIEGLSFSPDGRFLAVASADGVRIFSVLPGAK